MSCQPPALSEMREFIVEKGKRRICYKKRPHPARMRPFLYEIAQISNKSEPVPDGE